MRVLRCHGLDYAALQHVYRAIVVARLIYAASAWRGSIKASDRQRINSVIDHARRLGYCSPDTPTFDELCDVTLQTTSCSEKLSSPRTICCIGRGHVQSVARGMVPFSNNR